MIGNVRADSTLLDHDGPDLPGLLACGIVVGGFALLAGEIGLIAGIVTVGFWAFLGTPYAIAGGHAMLPGVVGDALAVPELVVLEIGFLGLVLSAVHRTPDRGRFVFATIVAVAALLLVVASTIPSWPLWAVSLVLLVALAAGMYLTHRVSVARDHRRQEETG